MFALGIGVLYLGYATTLYGYILIKGYDISFKQLFVGTWPPTTGSAAPTAAPATVGGAPQGPAGTTFGPSSGAISA